jgi:hypothetical protein
MENYKDLPFREPAQKTEADYLLVNEPFPEVERISTWSRDLTAATALLVLVSLVATVHAINVLLGSVVRFAFEVNAAYYSLGLALFFVVAATLLLKKKKAGWVLATLPLAFLTGVYTCVTFFFLYRIGIGKLGLGFYSGGVLLETLVQLLMLGGLSLLCSKNARSALQIPSRMLIASLGVGLLSGLGFGVSLLMGWVF